MDGVRVTTEGVGDLHVETERDGGVLDRLGVPSHTPLETVLCPECGLVRLYAGLEENSDS